METQSILNPYYNSFLNEKYSGNNTLATQTIPSGTPVLNSTINDNINAFGNLLLELIIDEYNTKNGTIFNSTDFGIVSMPNDQNSRCAYLIFPLFRSKPLVIRTYLELSFMTHISFNFLKYEPSPDYLNFSPNLIPIVRCNLQLNKLILNKYAVIISNFRNTADTLKVEFTNCPLVNTTTLFDILPNTFILNRRVSYALNYVMGNDEVAGFTLDFSIGNNLPFLSTYNDLTEYDIGNNLPAYSASELDIDFIVGNGMNANSAGSSTTITNYTIGNGTSTTSSSSTTTTIYTVGS